MENHRCCTLQISDASGLQKRLLRAYCGYSEAGLHFLAMGGMKGFPSACKTDEHAAVAETGTCDQPHRLQGVHQQLLVTRFSWLVWVEWDIQGSEGMRNPHIM